eukprot:9910542-Alexandrium_andersonii.AAC.1
MPFTVMTPSLATSLGPSSRSACRRIARARREQPVSPFLAPPLPLDGRRARPRLRPRVRLVA